MDNREKCEAQWNAIRNSLLKDNRGQDRLKRINDDIYEHYNAGINIPRLIKKDFAEVNRNEALIFLEGCLIDVELKQASQTILDTCYEDNQKKIEYFVSKDKPEILPYKFDNVLQINSSQWVCALDLKSVVDLFTGQLIHYNPETQRQQTIVRGSNNEIHSKITVNHKSVKEIEELIERGLFISNFITLNVNEDVDNDFVYDTEERCFVLKKGYFDIIDGFHRFLAMKQAYTNNPNINYITGVHIVSFPTDKAKRYIVQEDKKNKINKQYIKTLDGSDLINVLIDRLNETSYCATFGNIRNDGAFNRTLLYSAINKTYGKIESRSDITKVVKELAPVINDYYDHKRLDYYNIMDLLTICYASKNGRTINYNKIGFDSGYKLFSSKRTNITTEMIKKADWYTS